MSTLSNIHYVKNNSKKALCKRWLIVLYIFFSAIFSIQAQNIQIQSSKSKTVATYQVEVNNKITEVYGSQDDSELEIIIKRGHSSFDFPVISVTSADESIVKSIQNKQLESDTLRIPYNHLLNTFSIDLAIHLTGENCELDDTFLYEFVNEAPLIEDQTFVIQENIPQGTEIGKVIASDPDNDELVYAIQNNGTYAGVLDIDPATGIITLLDSAYNDFETIQQYLIRIEAYDSQLRNSGLITITVEDVNEAPTVIASQSIDIEENMVANTILGSFNATDPEGDEIIYTLKTLSLEGALSLSENGEILVADASLLDFETHPEISLTAEISDGEFSSESIFNISLTNVNEAPELIQAEFEVDDIAEVGTVIGQLEATDPEDDKISFKLTSNSEFFEVSETGVITLIKTPGADVAVQNFEINIQLSDGELTSAEKIKISTIPSIVTSLEGIIEGLKIYPNPVKNFLTIEFESAQVPNTHFQLIDAQGIQHSIPSTQSIFDQKGIDVQHLPKGIYLLTISNNNRSATLKILKD